MENNILVPVNWGPERTTYNHGNRPEYAVFNSITDHSEFGDERFFVKIAEKGQPYTGNLILKLEKEYEICIFFHNNAKTDCNLKAHNQKGIALNTKVTSSFPEILMKEKSGTIRAAIQSENTNPKTVWSNAVITASAPMALHYVENSIRIQTNEKLWNVNGMHVSKEELFSDEGTFLGTTMLDGKIRGGEKYAGKIVYLIRTSQISPADIQHILYSENMNKIEKLKQMSMCGALEPGPQRTVYTMDRPAAYPTFNSVTDNNVLGDERNFVRIVEKATSGTYSSRIEVEAGKDYDVYIAYHNNAADNLNSKEYNRQGVAWDVRLVSNYPQRLREGAMGVLVAKIISTNTKPEKVWALAYIIAKESVTLHYVAGSAKIFNCCDTNGSVLSDNLFSDEGTLLGMDHLDGMIFGGYQYSGYVIYTIRVIADREVNNSRKLPTSLYLDNPLEKPQKKELNGHKTGKKQSRKMVEAVPNPKLKHENSLLTKQRELYLYYGIAWISVLFTMWLVLRPFIHIVYWQLDEKSINNVINNINVTRNSIIVVGQITILRYIGCLKGGMNRAASFIVNFLSFFFCVLAAATKSMQVNHPTIAVWGKTFGIIAGAFIITGFISSAFGRICTQDEG